MSDEQPQKPVDEEVAVCTECHSDQPDQYIIKNIFFQQGGEIPCKYCSGLVIITTRSNRKRAINRRNRERGLPPA